MSGKQEKRRDLFSFVRLTMHVGGLQPIYSELLDQPKIIVRFLYIIDAFYEFLSYFVSVHLAVLHICTIALFYGDGDMEYLVDCAMQTVIFVWTSVMKVYFRRIKPRLLKKLFNSFNQGYQLRSAIGFTYVTSDHSCKLSDRYIRLYVYSCYISTVFWLILPIVYRDNSLPLVCWYPIDYKQPIVYGIIYSLQALAQIQVAAAYAASSGLFMMLGVLISGQYDVLYCNLKNVLASTYIEMAADGNALSKLKAAQCMADAEVNQYDYALEQQTPLEDLLRQQRRLQSTDFGTAFRFCFKRCLAQHRFILTTLERTECLFNPIWLLKIADATGLICLVAFVSVKSAAANSVLRVVSLGQYLLLVVYELFLICYYAERLYVNSQRCGDALWRSPWQQHLLELRSDYLFFLHNAKRPFQLSAGKISNLNMDRFKSIMTMSFSFLTLLQKMDERNK